MIPRLFGWTVARVDGDSMAPTLKHGDYILARIFMAHRASAFNSGVVALLAHNDLGLIIKRIVTRTSAGRYQIAGDNPLSMSSDAMGTVDTGQILALVRWRISPSGINAVR